MISLVRYLTLRYRVIDLLYGTGMCLGTSGTDIGFSQFEHYRIVNKKNDSIRDDDITMTSVLGCDDFICNIV